jgi:hypothetical protein
MLKLLLKILFENTRKLYQLQFSRLIGTFEFEKEIIFPHSPIVYYLMYI